MTNNAPWMTEDQGWKGWKGENIAMKKDGIDADIDAGGLDDKAKEMRVM